MNGNSIDLFRAGKGLDHLTRCSIVTTVDFIVSTRQLLSTSEAKWKQLLILDGILLTYALWIIVASDRIYKLRWNTIFIAKYTQTLNLY